MQRVLVAEIEAGGIAQRFENRIYKISGSGGDNLHFTGWELISLLKMISEEQLASF